MDWKIKIVLTDSQWERISEVSGNLGVVSLASGVIPYIFDKPNPTGAILGLVVIVFLWYISLVTARKY